MSIVEQITTLLGEDPDDLPRRLSESAAAVPMLFPDGEDEKQCDVADAAAWRMIQAARLLRQINKIASGEADG